MDWIFLRANLMVIQYVLKYFYILLTTCQKKGSRSYLKGAPREARILGPMTRP